MFITVILSIVFWKTSASVVMKTILALGVQSVTVIPKSVIVVTSLNVAWVGGVGVDTTRNVESAGVDTTGNVESAGVDTTGNVESENGTGVDTTGNVESENGTGVDTNGNVESENGAGVDTNGDVESVTFDKETVVKRE